MAAFASLMQLKNAIKNVKFNNIFKDNETEDHHVLTEFDSNDKLDTVRLDTRHMRKTWEKSRILQIILGKNFQFSRIMVNRMNRMIKLETINAFLALFVLITALLEYELAYFPKFYKFIHDTHTYIAEENPNKSYWGMPIRIIQSFVCIVTVIISILSNRLKYLLLIDKKSISLEDPFWKTSIFIHLIFDIFIDLIHPIPYLDTTLNITQMSSSFTIRLQTFLYIFTFLKVYIILRTLASHTKYTGLESQKFCGEAGMEPSTTFALKALQKDQPMIVLIITLISLCVVLGIILRMIEMVGSSKAEGYTMFANGIWNIIVAMTTVGYGDFFPETHFGRLILVFSVFIGTLIISLTVVNLNYISSFDEEEQRAFKIIENVNYRNELNHISQRIINTHFQLYSLKKSMDKKDIISSSIYSVLNHTLKKESLKRLEIMRNLQDSFASDIDKFQELNLVLTQNLNDLRVNLASMAQIRSKLKKQRFNQIKLLDNIQNSLKITRDHIKPMIYKMVYKHNRQFVKSSTAVDSEEIANLIGVTAFRKKMDLKLAVVKDMEKHLFGVTQKTDVKSYFDNLSPQYFNIETREFLDKKQKLERIVQKNKGNLTDENINYNRSKSNTMANMTDDTIDEKLKNENHKTQIKTLRGLLLNKISNYTFFLQNKYSKRQASIRMDSQTSIEYVEKDPVYHQFEEFNMLNQRTKQIYLQISKQTFDLFKALSNLKMKNKNILHKNIKSNMLQEHSDNLQKEDILESLTNDIDLVEEISELDLNEQAINNQSGLNNDLNLKRNDQTALEDELKSGISQSLANDTMSKLDNDINKGKSLLQMEKETKFNTLITKNKNDTSSKKGEKRNSNKKKDYQEIKNNDQTTLIMNNKLDLSNYEEIKNESNLELLKPLDEQKNNTKYGFNLSQVLNTKNNPNNKNLNNVNNLNQTNYNFFGGSGYPADLKEKNYEDINDNLDSDFNKIEEEKIDFSPIINSSILAANNSKNSSNNNFKNNGNNKFLNNKAIQGAFANKIKKNFFEEENEEAKNTYLANEQDNDGSGIGFFNNNDTNRTNTLNLPDSPDIRKKYSNNRLLNQINSNNNSYFDNNISVIQNMENGNLMDVNNNNNNFEKQKNSSDVGFNEFNNRGRENQNIGFNNNFNNSRINDNYDIKNGGNNNPNDKSNLNISSNNLDRKNTSNNNVVKSKIIDNTAKGKNMKNFANMLMNKKKNKDII